MRHSLVSMALAIFSMFFGAGNAIFPLILGIKAQDQFGWAFLGLMITAIGGPLLGLLGVTLYRGKFIEFFRWIGKVPSTILIGVTLSLLGPFAVLPRCTTVAFAATSSLFPTIPLWLFAIYFGLSALFCCWKKRYVVPTLGLVLSPLLISCLLMIITQGFISEDCAVNSPLSPIKALTLGLSTGYDTMDLIASIYFSTGIWAMIALRKHLSNADIFKTTLKAGALGCLFLAIIYFGLARSAAHFSSILVNVPPEQLMTHLANITLGKTFGKVANLAVCLACLTTVVSLTMTISNIMCKELFPGKLSYKTTVFTMLFITSVMSNFGFEMIMKIIHPAVSICYPVIIVLTIVNIYRKLRDAKEIIS